jgi:hypothetical protein
METYLYLSLIPESLVASNLPPVEFGRYLAVGARNRARGQAMFFNLTGPFESDRFDFSTVPQRCIPDAEGHPKHTLYLAIYRVMEHVPLEVIGSLWLVSPEARVLELKPGPVPAEFPGTYHLYQEICPVQPLVASELAPDVFCRTLTDPAQPIQVPRICFADLELSELAEDPQRGRAEGILFPHLDHLRNCILTLRETAGKHTKMVDRVHPPELSRRWIKNGFFLGGPDGMLYFPCPSREETWTKQVFRG